MKKVKLLLLFISTLLIALSFASCKKKVASAEDLHKATNGGEVEVTNGSVSKYKGVKKNIEITDDFTIDTNDEFFTELIGSLRLQKHVPGRMMKKSVINGNGHTITITGNSNGSLGRYSSGLFARLMDCEVRDLNIVYDLELKLNSSNSMGGICAVAENTKFINCTVTYKNGASYSGYRAGGLVGYSSNSTFENCRVIGDFKVSTNVFGGVVGALGGGVASNCNFEGSVTANDLHDAEIGGILGYQSGELYSSGATITKFSVSGKTDKWTNYKAYCGGIVGKLEGNLHDCYLKFANDAYLEATELSSGLFSTNMHTGAVAGYASKSATVKNILVDAMDDKRMNVRFPDNAKNVSLGIYTNESSNVEKIYYAENPLVHNHTEKAYATVSGDTFTFTISGKECTVRIGKTPHPDNENVYKISSLLLIIAGTEYNLTGAVDEHPLMPCFKADFDGFCYQVTASYEGEFVEFSKTHNRTPVGSATCVTDYADIDFDGDAWSTDEQGKIILK